MVLLCGLHPGMYFSWPELIPLAREI